MPMAEKFADPDVDEEIVRKIQDVIQMEEPVYPWVILDGMVDEDVERKEARKALRKLRMNNNVVPSGDFKGKLELAERLES